MADRTPDDKVFFSSKKKGTHSHMKVIEVMKRENNAEIRILIFGIFITTCCGLCNNEVSTSVSLRSITFSLWFPLYRFP